ncbi:MAG: hypothetical protein E7593_02635 [Ruminococcaceae bacterium]|nr:hypothetical protein [Oscillospiraceae bacterium]
MMERFMIQSLSNAKLATYFLYLQVASVVLLGLLVIFAIVFLVKYSSSKNKAYNTVSNENITLERIENIPQQQNEVIENKQELIAAICAAVAEENGTDISAIRVLSFKKL